MRGKTKHPATATDVERGTDYTLEEVEFMRAVERYRRLRSRPFPTCREILAVAHALGYRRVAAETELPRPGGSHAEPE